MKFIPLHTKNTTIVYKNALCSSATVLVLVFIALSVMIPLLLVSLLSPYSGIAESRVLYEQPHVQFQHKFIFLGEIEGGDSPRSLVACSTFPNLNARLQPYDANCEGSKYWSQDPNHDGHIDHAYFRLQLDELPGRLVQFDLVLFFETELKHKCKLSPPTLLTQRLTLPATNPQLRSGSIILKAELKLKQYIEFSCPFPGRNTQTQFSHVQLPGDGNNASFDLEQFKVSSLLQQVKMNPAYFQLELLETYISAGDLENQLRLELQLHVPQVAARYHLSVWERLGQFWLYFASFFGISFYLMNKLKDFLFGRHIIRAWEVIPWKKLY